MRHRDRRWTVEDILQRWKGFVEEVEEGFDGIVYDYIAGLAWRDDLDRLLGSASAEAAPVAPATLAQLDARFIRATEEDTTRSLGAFYRRAPYSKWWWKRKPRKLIGPLAEDLARADSKR